MALFSRVEWRLEQDWKDPVELDNGWTRREADGKPRYYMGRFRVPRWLFRLLAPEPAF